MADPTQQTPTNTASRTSGPFAEATPAQRSFPTAAIAVVAVVVLAAIAALAVLSHRKGSAGAGGPDTLQPLATYAPQLPLSGIALSESTSFSGGKSTFIDGHITNKGTATVTGIAVQVLFAQLGGGAPQLETVPLSLVRTRQPYVDTEPVSAAPLAPGATADFRLIFEGIRPEWDQQPPEIRITAVTTK